MLGQDIESAIDVTSTAVDGKKLGSVPLRRRAVAAKSIVFDKAILARFILDCFLALPLSSSSSSSSISTSYCALRQVIYGARLSSSSSPCFLIYRSWARPLYQVLCNKPGLQDGTRCSVSECIAIIPPPPVLAKNLGWLLGVSQLKRRNPWLSTKPRFFVALIEIFRRYERLRSLNCGV